MTTYKTLTGNKEILELTEDSYGQWIIYQHNKPMFHVNCFDFKNESNRILNSFLLLDQQPIDQIIKSINKKNNIKLSLKKAPTIKKELASNFTELELGPLPLEWIS